MSNKIIRRDSGLSSSDILADIKKNKEELTSAQRSLRIKKKNVEYQRKFRSKIKEIVKSSKGSTSSTPGRPRLESVQPELLSAIAEIAIHGSATHDRRRTEEVRSCKTLDDLHNQLNEMGFKLSRSATYLRLLPNNSATNQAKKHVQTVPVKLRKACNDKHKLHEDGKFCTTTIRFLESLASILDPTQVAFISQDDKARVPLGLTAAKLQSPLLMHMQYCVTLPDHDFVIARRHKLIPSVYAGITVKPIGLGTPESVSYSGPTYVAIRSGKHSSSNAYTHEDDFSV